jgi:hypothetical protein
MKARYATPLVFVLLPELLLPQLSHIKLAGSRENSRIRILLKPGDSNLMPDNHLDARTRIIAKEETAS